jgi:hypothetical protein
MQRGFIYPALAAGMAQHKKPAAAAFSSRRLQQNALAHFACCLISLSLSQRFNGIHNQPVEKVIVESDNAESVNHQGSLKSHLLKMMNALCAN